MISRNSKLPVAALERIDEACERFEQTWQDGQPSEIEPLLANVADADERTALFVELLALEIDYRRRSGAEAAAEDYLGRFPEEETAIRRVFRELAGKNQASSGAGPVDLSALSGQASEKRPAGKPASSNRSSSSAAFGDSDAIDGAPLGGGRYVVLEKLGVGGFATVYRAFDQSLQREVAIKVPHAHRADRYDLDRYLDEARLVAKLDHPSIVPVYDAGRTSEGVCYVVSKLINGQDLAQLMRATRLSLSESIAIVVQIADALTYAHQRGLVHRDLKPANVLIDSQRAAYVTDFGLAMETDLPRAENAFVGTPAYMSPEQAARESHLIDHRTDIFSLGVIFYELLTGRRPFSGSTLREVLNSIREGSSASPTQFVADLPPEVDRICMRAIAPRISDRFASAHDLRVELAEATSSAATTSSMSTVPAAEVSAQSPQQPAPTSSRHGVVPRGLRSFDESDSEGFVDLLPGPYDHSGLPTSLAFWLKRITPKHAQPFRVGLMSGPSGSGKSSLVKAGLIPRLPPNVQALFIEASAEHTEATLLEAIHRHIPGVPNTHLVDTLSALRRRKDHKKCVIFIDQFEQWLERHEVEPCQLIDALRHCDGEHLQCVLMVRDEFGMMAARLMYELDVPIEQGSNFAAVAPLSDRQARATLAKFGQALGQLPGSPEERSAEQDGFLDAAIDSISDSGRVMPVHLALFTEIMKDREWVAKSLAATGQHGLGVDFLEQSFGEHVSHPECRLHRAAARRVLKALLPARNIEIKGSLRTRAELLQISGYEHQPDRFDALLRLLDRELRLITPAEIVRGEAAPAASPAATLPQETGYLLAHDFMVAPLREWLTQKDKQTLRGRAELCLAERASWWADTRSRQHLPSLGQWLSIQAFANLRAWTKDERAMMRRASQTYLLRSMLLAAVVLVCVLGVRHLNAKRDAASLVDRIVNARQLDLPGLIDQAAIGTSPIQQALQAKLDDPTLTDDKRLNVLVAASRHSQTLPPELPDQLLEANVESFATACHCLLPLGDKMLAHLEPVLQAKLDETTERRFRAACAVAQINPNKISTEDDADLAIQLVRRSLRELPTWTELLKPLRSRLFPSLRRYFRDSSDRQTQQAATTVLAQLYMDQPDDLMTLCMASEGSQLAILLPALRNHQQAVVSKLAAEWAESFRSASDSQTVPLSTTKLLEEAGGLVAPTYAFATTLSPTARQLASAPLNAAGYQLEQEITNTTEDRSSAEVTALWRRGRAATHHGSDGGESVRADEQRQLHQTFVSPRHRQVRYLESNTAFAPQGDYYSVDINYLSNPGSPFPDLNWMTFSAFRRDPRPALNVVNRSGRMGLPAVSFDPDGTFTVEAWVGNWSGPIVSHFTKGPSWWMSVGDDEGAAATMGWTRADGTVACEQSLGRRQLRGWHHVAMVYDGERATCYLDGQPISSIPSESLGPMDPSSPSPVWLCHAVVDGSSRWGSGWLGGVRVSGSARYTEKFDPEQRFAFDETTLLSLDVTRPNLPVTELALTEDRLIHDASVRRSARMVRHMFLSGFDTEEHHPLASRLAGELYRPVWFARLPAKSGSDSPGPWQSRWTRAVDPPLAPPAVRRLANLAVALWSMGAEATVAPAFALRADNELRSQLITRLAEANCEPLSVLQQLQTEQDPGVRQALILALGEFGAQSISRRGRQKYVDVLQPMYSSDRDAGVHAAIEFLLNRWRVDAPTLDSIVDADERPDVQHRDWTRGPNQHQFVHVRTPNPLPGSRQFRVNFAPQYEVGLQPVTVGQFNRYAEAIGRQRSGHSAKKPMEYVTFYDAAAYCNWLSEQAGIPEQDWCFVDEQNDGKLMPATDYVKRLGYRLPSVAEWRLACGGGVRTHYFFGESDQLAEQYAWTSSESTGALTDIGLKKPNGFGLFDISGNVCEWVNHNEGDWSRTYGFACGSDRTQRARSHSVIAYRRIPRTTRDFTIGFRVARTVP